MFEKDCLRAPMALSAFDPAALGAFMGQTPAPAPPVPAPAAAAAVPAPAPAPAPVASAMGAWGKEAPWARAPPPTLQSLGDKKGSAPAAAALPADDDDESLELAPAAGGAAAAAARPLNLSSDDEDDDEEEDDDGSDDDDDDDSGDRDHAKGKTKVLGSGGGGASQPYTLERFEDSGHYLLVVNCPMDRAGLVIGYKGSTIRTIGAKAHARVTVSDVKVAAPLQAPFPALRVHLSLLSLDSHPSH